MLTRTLKNAMNLLKNTIYILLLTLSFACTGPDDTTAPVVVLQGRTTLDIVKGSTYTDAGAIARDNVDGYITANIVVGGVDAVKTNEIGEYPITHNVSDAAGNAADTKIRTVTVIESDTTPPVITLNEDAVITITAGADAYEDDEASATDNVDGYLELVVGGDTVDTSKVGTYTITYNVSDAAGNKAVEVKRTVTVKIPEGIL